MTMQTLINVGDEIKGCSSHEVEVVVKVIKGQYGLLVATRGEQTGMNYCGFYPYELPPSKDSYDWYGWERRFYDTLPNGVRLGVVCLARSDPMPRTIEAYDERWERTIELMREEEQDNDNAMDRRREF